MNIKQLRKVRRITQEELSCLMGVHENTIRLWEKGVREPRSSDIKKLCEVLGCTESELLNGPATQEWELRMVVSKTGDKEGGTVDMTGTGSTATLSIGDNAMAITLSADYALWEDDAKFEALMEDLRRKRQLGLMTRHEGWQ